jgi:hypothetical protein
LKNATVTVSIDGWTNSSGVSTIGICLNEHLWTVKDTGADSHTAQNLAIEALQAVAQAESEAQCVVVGICSDGASNMEAMKNILTDKRPDLKGWVCQAHCLQLLVGDLVKDKGRGTVLESVSQGIFSLVIFPCLSPRPCSDGTVQELPSGKLYAGDGHEEAQAGLPDPVVKSS